MPDGSTEDSGSWEQGSGALLDQVVRGSAEQRSAACEALSRLVMATLDILGVLLEQERKADSEVVFLVSLKMDVASRAVRQAVAELVSDPGAGHGSHGQRLTMSSDDFLRRVVDIALGSCDAKGQRSGGVALDLYDSGRYHRERRSAIEKEIIILVEEALERPDPQLRSHVFERLWQWAFQLSYQGCRNREAAEDLASDAIVCLLRRTEAEPPDATATTGATTHRKGHAAYLAMSGVEVVRRVYSTLMGGMTEDGRRWPGLIQKYVSDTATRRELPLDRQLAADDELSPNSGIPAGGARRHEAGVADGHIPANFQSKRALRLCREQLVAMLAAGQIGQRSSEALGVVLDVLEEHVHDAQPQRQEEVAFTVAVVERRAVVEPDAALPALRAIVPVARPRSIRRRLLAVKDQLVLSGLVDENWEPRPATFEDLSRMLDALEALGSRREFRKHRRQSETIRAVVAFWRSDIQARRRSPADGDFLVRLPPLVKWRRRVHIQESIALRLQSELGLSPTAVHNLIKRSLDLLTAWGLVKEIRDG